MNFGISTIYFSKDITKKNLSWEQIKDFLRQTGINSVELNADIPVDWFDKIEQDVNKNEINILSMHNFCPAVENIPEGKYGFNVFTLNSSNDDERAAAVKYTLRTIDFAEKLSAKAVVLHLGEIPTTPSGTEVYKIATQFGINSKIFIKYKELLLSSREQNKQKYFDLLYSVMDKLVPYAENKNVNLAIETRFFPHEIPNFEEIGEIINHYKSRNLFYWHDFGHVEIQKRLTFTPDHQTFFNQYKNYLLGYHIHGVKNLIDHYSPSNSELDYKKLISYDNDKIYILEVHGKENFTDLVKGINLIKSLLLNGKSNERISS